MLINLPPNFKHGNKLIMFQKGKKKVTYLVLLVDFWFNCRKLNKFSAPTTVVGQTFKNKKAMHIPLDRTGSNPSFPEAL